MASHIPHPGRASAIPLSAVLASIPSYPRPVVERLVARMIDHLDEQDGDPDFEDATNAEDEGITPAARQLFGYGQPGCPVSDPGGGDVGDEGEIETWSHPDDHPAQLFIGRRPLMGHVST